MSDTIRDDEMVDIHRVEKYFDRDAWLLVLKSSSEKNCIDFVCSVCTKMINDEREDSIACDRCLLWSHFKCTSLKKRPKHRNWFCTSCRVKYAWLFTRENEAREPTAWNSPVSMIIICGFPLILVHGHNSGYFKVEMFLLDCYGVILSQWYEMSSPFVNKIQRAHSGKLLRKESIMLNGGAFSRPILSFL